MRKQDKTRLLTDAKVRMLPSDAGKLAWLATGSASLSAFQGVAFQRHRPHLNPQLRVLTETWQALLNTQKKELSALCYVPLKDATMNLRVYSDGSFQNLDRKHSQIGFLIALADSADNINIVHGHSLRSTRRPSSMEQA